MEVEYALRPTSKPIGVSEYKLTKNLPEKLKGKMPTTEELKELLSKVTMKENNEEKLKR